MSKKKPAPAKTEAPAESPPNKPGPKPKLEHSADTIDTIRKLGKIQATVEEVASFLNVSERTLQNFFAMYPDAKEAHEDGKRQGLTSLRRMQFQMAASKPGMAIWLGKQYLGQREPVQQIETGGPGDFARMSDAELDEHIAELHSSIEEAAKATQH